MTLGVVTNSTEFQRIFHLPREPLDLSTTPDVTPLFARAGSTLRFWPIQSAAVIAAARAGGLFGAIEVGAGKTLIALALPTALEAKRALILTRAKLRDQMVRELATVYAVHFELSLEDITIASYNDLSSPDRADFLDALHPDLIVADEAHCLRNLGSARTGRVARYLSSEPGCRFCAMSGTITSRSILDYAHLLEWALGKGSPLPRTRREASVWAGALDARPLEPCAPGVLRQLCRPGESVREGYRRRLAETPGVVVSTAEGAHMPLVIRRRTMDVPKVVLDALEHLDAHWEIGDQQIESAMSLARVVRQIACGFYYVWRWPVATATVAGGVDHSGGVDHLGGVDHEWLAARAAWYREVRERLKRPVKGLDSEALCARAAERTFLYRQGKGKRPRNLLDSTAWKAWREHRHKPEPPKQAVWLSMFLVEHALEWSAASSRSIVWYSHRAVGQALRERGMIVYGQGVDASLATEDRIACSVGAQGVGRQLQRYCRNLILCLPSSGAVFEQLVGRTHRPGQMASQVDVEWMAHVPALETALASVKRDAQYAIETTGSAQKVLTANLIV